MIRAFLLLLVLILHGGFSSVHAAVPSVALEVSANGTGSSVQLSLTPSGSAAGCAYALYAAGSSRELRSDVISRSRIARLGGAEGAISRQLTGLRTFRDSSRRSRTVYFRARLSCPDGSSLSAVRRVSLRARSQGLAPLHRWLDYLGSRISQTAIKITPVFGALEFTAPVVLTASPDASNRLFVVEQGGKIFSFENSSAVTSATLFLDISSRIVSSGELGLLGLAFHPAFAQNGQFFVNYTEPRPSDPDKARSVISRFTLTSPGAGTAAGATEQRLIEVDQPFDNHNGGDLAFGNDGYLYIALGDGGSGGDPLGNAQNRATLLGKILRIDVDSTSGSLNYAIPPTNPFVGNASGFREEIFAYGLRNPFRMSIDAATGNLWAGDVGQGAREEIDVIVSGANYGWNRMEGKQCYPPESTCDRSGLTLPVIEYGRDKGTSVIGGYVYRGSAVPRLAGVYVYADFVSGRIF